MHDGSIPLASLAGDLDLRATLESGQSYLWRRSDGGCYDGPPDDAWYWAGLPRTFTPSGEPEVLRIRREGGRLRWQATTPSAPALLTHLLRLDDDLAAVYEAAPDDPVLDAAFDAARGLRLVRDPAFDCLVSFICSAQMRVARIHEMQVRLAEAYGETATLEGRRYPVAPTPADLAGATEGDLRDLGLGYRAPYVARTARMVADGEAHPEEARGRPYEAARESLTRFVGVGPKVADCVLLFSLGYLEAVPLDTWIRTAIDEHYPDCERASYERTSRAIIERLGGRYAGYAQTYLFHHLRTGDATTGP